MENSIDFGEIVILISDGDYKPTKQEKVTIVKELLEIIVSDLKNNYKVDVEFEIVSIRNGCILAKVKLLVVGTGIAFAGIMNYPDLKAGALELWGDRNNLYKISTGDLSLQAGLYTNGLIEKVHVVKSGENLSQIASKWKPESYTIAQFTVALYLENDHAFINKNINKLKTDVILKYPRQKFFKGLNKAAAESQLHTLSNK